MREYVCIYTVYMCVCVCISQESFLSQKNLLQSYMDSLKTMLLLYSE